MESEKEMILMNLFAGRNRDSDIEYGLWAQWWKERVGRIEIVALAYIPCMLPQYFFPELLQSLLTSPVLLFFLSVLHMTAMLYLKANLKLRCLVVHFNME